MTGENFFQLGNKFAKYLPNLFCPTGPGLTLSLGNKASFFHLILHKYEPGMTGEIFFQLENKFAKYLPNLGFCPTGPGLTLSLGNKTYFFSSNITQI